MSGKTLDGTLVEHLREGDGVIDVGANQGRVAASYARVVGPSGSVLAVEPEPTVYQDLVRGLRKWAQAHPLHAAVGDVDGQTTVYPDGAQTSRWAALTVHQRPGVGVPMTTLDALAPTVPRLRGIKVDVQGGEMDVLRGATATLRDPAIVWQLELWPHGLMTAGTSVADVCGWLAAAGLVPLTRSWDTVQQQAAALAPTSYFDVVCRHGA